VSWCRFGELKIQMDPSPGAIGGQVGGSLELPLAFDSRHRFPVTLACLQRNRIDRSGDGDSYEERVIWQAEGLATASSSLRGTHLSFCFDVPNNLPASEPASKSYHYWRLTLKAEPPELRLNRQFELPVFPTGERAARAVPLSTDHPDIGVEQEVELDSVLIMQPVPGGVELDFPMFKHVGSNVTIVAMGLVFGGIGIGLWFAPNAPAFLAVLFILMGSTILVAGLYALFRSLRVRLDHDGITNRRYWLGIPAGSTYAPRSEVVRLCVKVTGRDDSNGKQTEFFAIEAHTAVGKKLAVAINIKGRPTAERALAKIAQASGYPI
jgi:hypothetical protein